MPTQQQLREQITQSIIAALESGSVPPWRRPWRLGKNAGAPANAVSRRGYRGLNLLLLDVAATRHNLTSRHWATFRQWKALGGRVLPRPTNVPPGRWGTSIVFWSPVVKTVKNEEGEEDQDRFFFMKTYTVFNVDQVAGDHLDHLRAGQPDDGNNLVIDYEPADEALEAARTGMGISLRYGGGKAFYSPTGDYIQMPPKATFESVNEFYATAFHEMTHATEHPSRLDWCRKNREHAYALGELIAELGGVFVCRELGVPASEDLTNHTAYLASWLSGMRSDGRFVIMAAAQASKAASYILGFSRNPDDVPEEDSELATT